MTGRVWAAGAVVLGMAGLLAMPAAGQSSAAAPGGFAGLASLPQLRNAETRSISPENPTGERGGGAKAVPTPLSGASDLGTGWKVSPDIVLVRRRTVTIADIEGPGVIQHIWITVTRGGLPGRDFPRVLGRREGAVGRSRRWATFSPTGTGCGTR